MGLFDKLKKVFTNTEKHEDLEIYDKGLEKTRKEFVSELSLLGIKYTKVSDEKVIDDYNKFHPRSHKEGDN